MKVVKILEGHFAGLHGIIEGYHYEKAKVVVPLGNDRDEVVLLKSDDYEVIET
ncbi:RNA-binding domain protein [Bacillus phage 010DV004]|nr:RNA-binding domain protein [Bacillus phage 010DV004]QZA69269.1 RNA-binding domain protein [Bacillus phage 010DV005]QZA69836.1 RNA-binding domain protein [Bacillus phage 043JT007]